MKRCLLRVCPRPVGDKLIANYANLKLEIPNIQQSFTQYKMKYVAEALK